MNQRSEPFDSRLAMAIARRLALTPLSPNLVTAIGLGLGLAAAFLFATGRDGWAGALLIAALFGDHLDGALARAAKKTSRFGHWFDRAATAANLTSVFIGIGLGLDLKGVEAHGDLLGIVAGVSVAAIMGLRNLGATTIGGEFFRESTVAGFQAADCLYLIAPLAWLGWLQPFLWLAAVGAPIFLAWTAGRYAWARPAPARNRR